MSDKVYIIAEAGVNHGGDLNVAKKLVDVAVRSGADAVKFQAFRTEHLIIDEVEKAPYQKETTGAEKTQSEMLKELELNLDHYIEMKAYCEQRGIDFLITPFDEKSLEELESIGIEKYKIASTDTTNIPFLRKVAQTKKPIFLSTGMSYMSEVEQAVEEILKWNEKLILMQCTANYPIDDEEANLNVIKTYQKRFPSIQIGYSDHSTGLGASLYSIPLGAVVVEKHFTLDKNADGPDHRASLSPDELRQYVKEIRRIEKFMGSFEKKPTINEQETRKSLQKCLVAACDLKKGTKVQENDIVAKRTGGKGISPLFFDKVVGKVVNIDLEKNQIIKDEFFK